MAERPPLWIFVALALAISAMALGFGQIAQGAGVMFVIVATFAWMGVAQKCWGNKVRG